MVFCFQNCSDHQWEKIVLVIKINVWNSMLIIRTINSNSDWSDQFLKKNAYLTSSWKFHRCIVLELLKLKKELGFRNLKEKLEKNLWHLAISPKRKNWGCGLQKVDFRMWLLGTAIWFLNKVFTNLGVGNLGYLGCGLSGSLGYLSMT